MKAVTVRLMEKKHDEAIDRLIQSHKKKRKRNHCVLHSENS